jgi:Leucine-rich repeat (LRR) protein
MLYALWLAGFLMLPLAQAATDCATVSEIPSLECEALVALYNSTAGANWSNNTGWNVTNTPCNWYGVSCKNGHVTSIDLHSNSLSGSIPSELGKLSHLAMLYLDHNSLSGSIPSELGNLSRLMYLYLDNNSLSGSIPSELGNLSHLTDIRLFSNSLSGSIPSELGNLSRLTEIYLDNNSLSGSIPRELGNLSRLTDIRLDNNSLCGKIPYELMALGKLSTLKLQNNNLINSEAAYDADFLNWLNGIDSIWTNQLLPSYCSLLQFSATGYNVNEGDDFVIITVIRTGGSEGAITVNYATSDGTATTGSDYTEATGTLNWADGDTANKTFTINISNDSDAETDETINFVLTEATGGAGLGSPETAVLTIIDDEEATVCAAVSQIPSLECEALVALYNSTDGANWSNNTGWNQTTAPCNWYGVSCENGHVTSLDLHSNSLSGEIPRELGNLSHLTNLNLGNNSLSGEIPRELGNLSRLTELWLFSNELSGSIPRELGNLSHLAMLYLDHNSLSGEIPRELGNLSRLTELYLDNNSLCGKIPYELMALGNLSTLKLQNNNLINPEAAYDTDFLNWLNGIDSSWTNQLSPSDCSLDLSINKYNRLTSFPDFYEGVIHR